MLERLVHLLDSLNLTIFAIMVITAQKVQIIQTVGEPLPTGSLVKGTLLLLALLESIVNLQMSHQLSVLIAHWEIIVFNQLVARYENQCTAQWDTIVMASRSILFELGIRMAKISTQFIQAGFHLNAFIPFSDWTRVSLNQHHFENPLKPTLHHKMGIMLSVYPTRRTIMNRVPNPGVILDQNSVYLVHGQIERV